MNQIINDDCVAGLQSLGAGSVALTVTSPPWDDLYGLGKHFDFQATAQQLYRITSAGGVVCWEVMDQTIKDKGESGTSSEQRLYFRHIGFRLHETIVGIGCGFRSTPARHRHIRIARFIYVMSKGRTRTFNPIKDRPNVTAGQPLQKFVRAPDGRLLAAEYAEGQYVQPFGIRTNVWKLKTARSDANTQGHPTRMSEDLASDLILTYSRPGNVILDPFAGTGTTCKMAALLGRKYIGFEIDPKWCAVAQRRVRAAIIGGLFQDCQLTEKRPAFKGGLA
jgi:site-specific DNA-methyltransferase (adenine-specific)